VLSSAILRRFKSEAELRFLIGHEMGHIRARHVKMLTVLRCLAAALCLGGAVPDEVALLPLLPVFMWSREAEMTADNAGLICAQDRAAAETALVRQLLNLSEQDIGKINVEQFLGQREAEEHSRFSEIVLCVRQVISSHPFTPDRVRQIREYAASPRYRHIWH
jgi:Zn-dependent protease with chaperone function